MNLPGSMLSVPAGSMCDEHEDRPAVCCIQGETDSFGYESILMCEECYAKYSVETIKPRMGWCDWCYGGDMAKIRGHAETEVFPVRDHEEGLNGPVYYVCRPCRTRMNNRIAEEYDAMQKGSWS